MKVLYNGKEIEINTELEKGEAELDLVEEENSNLEDTIELESIKDLNNNLEDTKEFYFLGDESRE